MDRLRDRLLRRIHPREGWVPWLLLLTATCCLPLALVGQSGRAGPLLLGVLGMLTGRSLAHSRLSSRTAALLATLLGLALAVVTVGQLWPPLDLLWQEASRSLAWLRGAADGAPPLSTLGGFLWQRLEALSIRLWWWSRNATGGQGPAQDQVAVELAAHLAAWSMALVAAWSIYRRRAALAGLLPGGLLLALLAFFRGGLPLFYFFVYLACTPVLLAICRLWTDRERWEETGTDYPAGLGAELGIALVPWLVMLLALGAIFPVFYDQPLREAFWRVMDEPWYRVERVAERFLGPIDSQYPVPAGGRPGEGEGVLPQSHLLGAGPELSETVVLYVGTDDPPPPPEADGTAGPRRYWRGATFDVYTGRGWTNSAVKGDEVAAGQALEATLPPGHDLLQQFELLQPGPGPLYAANNPYRLDQAVEARWRAEDDLAQLWGLARRYAVVSRVAEPTAAELQAAAPLTASLPTGVAERYLALPEGLPARVMTLTMEVVGQATTRYDAARRIEAYLRTYPYTLDLPPPPEARDLVDYFLFDLQEGYCDYYASAMVVMARAAGLPARLATGYVQGGYDAEGRRWVVTEQDGHSWVEVYFEGVGWVEFEPTAGRPALSRPGGEALPEVAVPPRPPQPRRWWQSVPWGLVILGAVAGLLLAAVAWLWRPRPALSAGALIWERYGRLVRWGGWLRRPLRDGQTPGEYGRDLARALEARGAGARLPQARRAGAEAPQQVEELAEAFVEARYGPGPVPGRRGWQIQQLWARLRHNLWWLWLGRPRAPDDKEGAFQIFRLKAPSRGRFPPHRQSAKEAETDPDEG